MSVDSQFMNRALALAEMGLGFTCPNPAVGAVIVHGTSVVGEGYHARAGSDHAEIVALKRAGSMARGATMYVTLEPCCHVGRTGPCTSAILEAGISRVVYALKDPDPRVNGRGARTLKKGGVRVRGGMLQEESRRLNEGYFSYHERGRPFVILKMAQSIDGRIATSSGDSKWISGPEALKLAHRLRAVADGVVVGMGTVRRDNPALTVRLVKGRNPYRIIVSGSLRFPKECQLLRNNEDRKTIIASTPAAIEKFTRTRMMKNVICWEIRAGRSGLVDMQDFVSKAGAFGMRTLLVEGGAHLATALLKAQLVDKYMVVIAPMVIGEGTSSVSDLGTRKLAESMKFSRHWFEACGQDELFIGYPAARA